MSRALNIDASEADIVATCASKKAGISMIEALASGGTRVVLYNAVDTATIRRAFGKKVIEGRIRRMPTRLTSQ